MKGIAMNDLDELDTLLRELQEGDESKEAEFMQLVADLIGSRRHLRKAVEAYTILTLPSPSNDPGFAQRERAEQERQWRDNELAKRPIIFSGD
jgi:hypothetical protein